MPLVVVGRHCQDVGRQRFEDIAADRNLHLVLGDIVAVVGILVVAGIVLGVPLLEQVDIAVLDSDNLVLAGNLAAEGILEHLELAGDTGLGDTDQAAGVGTDPRPGVLMEHQVDQGDIVQVGILTF